MSCLSYSLSYQRHRWLKNTIGISMATIRQLTAQPIKPKKEKAEGSTRIKFVDFKKVRVKGGDGGNGCMSFSRVAKNEFAGPDGGNGGCGGHVVFTCVKNQNSLGHLQREIRAESGVVGRSCNMHGKNAPHLYIEIPPGTIIRDIDGKTISELESNREYYIAARGGEGGKGNQHFVSATDTIPQYVEKGAEGEDRVLYVELKTMAHTGLIGFPNAGKSTLLRAISRARPKVAAYPFTTLHPHVGMVEYDDFVQIAVADIPGLIPGAHQNYGLGISFLRHIERCACLLYVIDLSEPQPWTQLDALKYELEQYKPGLSTRPHAIIGNKIDLQTARDNYNQLTKLTDLPVFPLSAHNKQNLRPLLRHLRFLYDKHGDKSVSW